MEYRAEGWVGQYMNFSISLFQYPIDVTISSQQADCVVSSTDTQYKGLRKTRGRFGEVWWKVEVYTITYYAYAHYPLLSK